MSQQPLPWSHSSLSTFTSCPKKFYHLKVVKDVVDSPPGEAALWGDYLHKTFEKALKTGDLLPTELAQYQPYIDKLVKLKGDGEAHVELKLGLNAQRGPTDFFANDVWSRGIIDYLVIRGSRAVCIDFKTGKVKPTKQLLQNALMVFAHYPRVQQVDTIFEWLKFGSNTHEVFHRENIPQMWSQYDQELASYALAFRQDIWPARQSGLCRGWCPVTTCPHWRPKK